MAGHARRRRCSPWVSADVAHLHVIHARHDVEAAVSPSVPDWREENVAVRSVGREDGDQGTLKQPVEVVGAEALSHGGECSHTWHSGVRGCSKLYGWRQTFEGALASRAARGVVWLTRTLKQVRAEHVFRFAARQPTGYASAIESRRGLL